MSTKAVPVEVLKEEHTHVLGKLEALEGIFKRLDQKEAVASDLAGLISFFKADFWLHFDKEEQALFPEFDNFMPRGVGPLAVMMEEHQVLRNTNEILQRAVAAYLGSASNPETTRTIIESGSHFIEFLRSHINKEDHILFSMAEMHLNQNQNQKVLKLFNDIEKAAQLAKTG
jgi:hemerythrin-like domain-containing protein